MVPPLGLAPSSREAQQRQQYRSQSVSKAAGPPPSVSFARDAQRAKSTARAVSTSHAQRHTDHPTSHGAALAAGVERGLRRRPPTDIPTTIFQYHTDDTASETPEQVARGILTLRQSREQQRSHTSANGGSNHRRSSHGSEERHQSSIRGQQADESHRKLDQYLHRSVSAPRPQTHVNQRSTKTHTTPNKTASAQKQQRTVSNYLSPQSSPEEQRASACLQKVEAKVNGLMQELDDLRFLEEIDLQDTPDTPNTVTAATAAPSRMRPRPTLPPPSGPEPPSMVQLLSPRSISKMDRMALELETQTLCRTVDVLNKEKGTLEKAVAMYELSLQDHERNERESHKEREQQKQLLERDVRAVKQQLAQAKHELALVRTQVATEYYDRMADNVSKLQRTQQAADQFQSERDALQTAYDTLVKETEETQSKWKKEEARSRKTQQAKEAELDLQVQQVSDLADDLREQLEQEKAVVRQLSSKLEDEMATRDGTIQSLNDQLRQQSDSTQAERKARDDLAAQVSVKDRELADLKTSLRQSEQSVRTVQNSKDEAYEVQVSSLQEQLSLQKDQCRSAVLAKDELEIKLRDHDRQLQESQKKCADQVDLIQDMTSRLDAVHKEYREKFGELKDAYESKEKRRLEEMVQSHAKEVDEYERRLSAMKEQLLHQNDRHAAEITQKNLDMERGQEERVTVQRELETSHTQQVTVLKEQVLHIRLDFEQADAERKKLRREMESYPTKEETLKVQKEREFQDMDRENEMNRLRVKADRLLREIAEKESKLQSLSSKLHDTELTHATHLTQIKNDHSKAMLQFEEKSTQQIKALQSSESKLLSELERLQSDLREVQSTTSSQILELQDALAKSKVDLGVARQLHDESDTQLRAEMSVLEGKRKASVAALQDNNDAIDDLQEKFNALSTATVEKAEAHRREVVRLQLEIKESQKHASVERSDLTTRLELGQNELQERCEQIRKLESMFASASAQESVLEKRVKEVESAFRDAKAELIAERTRHESTEDQTRADMARLQGRLLANEASLKEKRETIIELEDKLRAIADQSSSTNKEMQKEVEQLRHEVRKLEDLVDQYRAEIFEKDGLLKQQKSKLRQTTDDTATLQDSLAKYARMEEEHVKVVYNLKASLDTAKCELESELRKYKSSEARLQERIGSIEADLRDGEVQLQQKSAMIDSLESALKQKTDESSASVLELRSTIDALRNDVAAENRLLEVERQKVAVKTSESKDLERERSILQEQLRRLQELEGRVSVTVQSETGLKEELISLQNRYETSERMLDAEKKCRRDLETQMQETKSALEESLRLCNSKLGDKNEMILDLERSLKLAQDDSSNSVKVLQADVKSLERDLATANEALKRESDALKASVEEYNQMKEANWNLRQKTSLIDKLESTISDLQHALSVAESEMANKSRGDIETSGVLETKLESERRAKESLLLRIDELEADLEIKERQLARLPALQTQLKQLVDGREELQLQFERLESELERKDKQLSATSTSSQESVSDLEAALDHSKKSCDTLEVKLRAVESELVTQRKEASQEYDELKAKLGLAEAELQARQVALDADARLNYSKLEKAKQALETQVRLLEEDRADREAQVKASSERYSNQILELQMKVEELSRTKLSLNSRLSRLEVDLEQRDELMNATSHQLSNDVSTLQSQLCERLTENETLKTKLEETEAKLVENETAKEIQAKLDAEAKEKRSLLSRLGDVEAELERKEKQIGDIVDRYTGEISELQCKLEDELRSAATLQKDVDKLLRGENSISASAVARLAKEQVEKALVSQQRETAALQIELDRLRSARDPFADSPSDGRTAELTKTIVGLRSEMERVRAAADQRERHLKEQLVQAMGFSGDTSRDVTDLEDKLSALERSKADLEERLKKVHGERTEVMAALGDLIGEVQSRDDEIEALAMILKKREEELEHAKLIATKALSSAQDLKARCRSLEGSRKANASGEITELNSSVDYLSKTNESLERKTSRMERTLHEKESECNALRERLKRAENGSSRRSELADEKKQDDDGFQSLDGGFPTFETTSPTTRASSLVLNDSMSTQSEEIQGSTGWLHDFSSQSVDSNDETASFADGRSRGSSTQSKKASEKDSYLRKYIRSKYTKQKGSM